MTQSTGDTGKLESADRAGGPTKTVRGSKWRAFVSVVLLIVATLLLPLGVVAGWVKTVLVSEDAFVSTLAPLASEPAVQEAITEEVSAAVEQKIDMEGLVNEVIDGIQSIGLPDQAETALDLLRAPAVDGANAMVEQTVAQVVESDAFATTWKVVLSSSHKALLAVAAGGDGDGTVGLDSDGNIVLDLSPVVAQVKQALINKGFSVAENIPTMSVELVVAQADALAYIRPAYSAAVTIGWVLPLVSLALFAGGVFLARNRRNGAVGAGIGMVVGSGLSLFALALMGSLLRVRATALNLEPEALGSVFDQVVLAMRQTLSVVLVLGLLILVGAWVSGNSRPARAIRAGASSTTYSVAASIRSREMSPSPVSVWFAEHRRTVRAVIAVAVVLALILLPKYVSVVVWTLVAGGVLWWICEVLIALPAERDQSETSSANSSL